MPATAAATFAGSGAAAPAMPVMETEERKPDAFASTAVKGMPSSITSAPAAGRARKMASEVSRSGSPAVRNVTSAARPCALSSAKRRSMRVLMSARSSLGRAFAPALAHRGHAHVDGAQHQDHERADELHPFLPVQDGTGGEQPDPQEIRDIGDRDDDQNPADELLPAQTHPDQTD